MLWKLCFPVSAVIIVSIPELIVTSSSKVLAIQPLVDGLLTTGYGKIGAGNILTWLHSYWNRRYFDKPGLMKMSLSKDVFEEGLVAHACNPSTEGTRAEGSRRVQGWLALYTWDPVSSSQGFFWTFLQKSWTQARKQSRPPGLQLYLF